MSAPNLNFSRAEYAERLAKTRKAMERAGIDLLIVTDPSNMHWLTGYDGWSFYVHQCVLVPPDGEPVWYGRGQDANGAKRTAYLAHDNIIGYPDHYVQSTERHPMDYLSGIIGERGWDKGTIAVEMDNYYFSAAAYQSLVKHLPNAKFKDSLSLVNWQRAVKSPAGDRIHEDRGPHRGGDARAHPREGRARHPQERSRRRDLRRSVARRRWIRRRLCGHRAASSLRRGGLRPTPDLGRQAHAQRRRNVLRDCGLLQALSLPPVPHRLPRQTDTSVPRRREGGPGRDGGRVSRPQSPAMHARTSPTRFSPCSSATASSRTTAPATRSA